VLVRRVGRTFVELLVGVAVGLPGTCVGANVER
jgi:hypothetical protein